MTAEKVDFVAAGVVVAGVAAAAAIAVAGGQANQVEHCGSDHLN